MHSDQLEARLRAMLAFIPGFPDQKYNFPDITPLLERDPELFHDTIAELISRTEKWSYDTVLCVESFGYIFGVPLALQRRCKIVLMRRPGKLPRPVLSQDYSMCYDSKRVMQIHADALLPSSRVLVVDDFLVSGGTVGAALDLIDATGASAVGVVCIVENPAWNARDKLAKHGVPILTLTTI